jgi:hypothetical protein
MKSLFLVCSEMQINTGPACCALSGTPRNDALRFAYRRPTLILQTTVLPIVHIPMEMLYRPNHDHIVFDGVVNAIRKTPDEVTPNFILDDAPDGRPFENYSMPASTSSTKASPNPALADCSIDQPLRTRPPLRQRSGVSCPQSGSNFLDYFCPINEICFAGAHRSPAFPDFIQVTPLNACVCFTREAGEKPFHQ